MSLVLTAWLGCSDDSGETKSAAKRPRAAEQEVDASVQPALPDETAGKGCKQDADCKPGTCLTSFQPVSGGTMEAPGGYCSLTCMSNEHCGAGGTCSGAFAGFGGIGATPGRCLKSCAMNADCREGYRCVTALGMPVNGSSGTQDPTAGLFGGTACEPVPATQQLANGIVGKPCGKHTDCGEGRCQRAGGVLTYPDGYCSAACLEDADCGADGVCTPPMTGGAGSCSRRCETDGDCREGYRCRATSGQLQCVPGAAPLPDNVVGLDCKADSDCGGAAMSCASRLGNANTVAGYCTQACIETNDCGAGGVCVGALSGELAALLGTMGSCYRACSATADCRDGYACDRPTDLLGTASAQSVCVVAASESADDAGVGGP